MTFHDCSILHWSGLNAAEMPGAKVYLHVWESVRLENIALLGLAIAIHDNCVHGAHYLQDRWRVGSLPQDIDACFHEQ